jgi:hypothetical protein
MPAVASFGFSTQEWTAIFQPRQNAAGTFPRAKSPLIGFVSYQPTGKRKLIRIKSRGRSASTTPVFEARANKAARARRFAPNFIQVTAKTAATVTTYFVEMLT